MKTRRTRIPWAAILSAALFLLPVRTDAVYRPIGPQIAASMDTPASPAYVWFRIRGRWRLYRFF